MAARYLIGDGLYSAEDDDLEEVLAYAYDKKLRPLCACRDDGVAMYIARAFGRHHIRRMPFSSVDHEASCSSFDPPVDLFGEGELRGSAIKENVEEGFTALVFDFPFTKGAARKPAPPGDESARSVKTSTSKLGLRATLHYLWSEGELTKWSPGMAGKRSWAIVRRQILLGAEAKRAKGAPLLDHLFVPETYRVEHKAEIAQRRRGWMAKMLTAGPSRARPLMLMVGEVKDFAPSRYGFQLVVKHLPDLPVYLSTEDHKRVHNVFAGEIGAWRAESDRHLVAIALFGLNASGSAEVQDLALMLTDPNWLPIEPGLDAMLIEELVAAGRRFVRGMRFNVGRARPIAAALLHDTHPRPTALFIEPAGSSPEFVEALDALIAQSAASADAWRWRVDEGDIPALPAKSAMAPATNLFRPMFLSATAEGLPPYRIVTVGKPRARAGAGGEREMVVAIDRVIADLTRCGSDDLVCVGKPTDLVIEGDCALARLTAREVEQLRALDRTRGLGARDEHRESATQSEHA